MAPASPCVVVQEVFLRLAAQNREVNYQDSDASQMEEVIAATAMKQRVCVLCRARAPELVTLFTKHGISVATADVICSSCAEARQEVAEEKAAPKGAVVPVLAAPAVSSSGGYVPPVPVAHSEPAIGEARVLPTASGPRAVSNVNKGHPTVQYPTGAGHSGAPLTDPASSAEKYTPPVSFGKQAFAVLMLRLQLQAKQRKTNVCQGAVFA